MVDFLALLGLRAKPGQKVDPAVAKRLKQVTKPKTEEELRIEAATKRRDEIGQSIPNLKGGEVQTLHGVLDKGTSKRLNEASGEAKES